MKYMKYLLHVACPICIGVATDVFNEKKSLLRTLFTLRYLQHLKFSLLCDLQDISTCQVYDSHEPQSTFVVCQFGKMEDFINKAHYTTSIWKRYM